MAQDPVAFLRAVTPISGPSRGRVRRKSNQSLFFRGSKKTELGSDFKFKPIFEFAAIFFVFLEIFI